MIGKQVGQLAVRRVDAANGGAQVLAECTGVEWAAVDDPIRIDEGGFQQRDCV